LLIHNFASELFINNTENIKMQMEVKKVV
jgi:hypothetical protein